MIKVEIFENFGRGVMAEETLPASTIVEISEVLVLSPEDTIKVNETALKYYTFSYNENQDCLVLGAGELFNHSSTPNVGYYLIENEGRKKMFFVTLCQVEKGKYYSDDA